MKCSIMAGNLRRMVESGTVKYEECRRGCDVVLYPTLSAGHHFICRLPGSGKDWAQNCCMGGAVDLMRQLITDSLVKYYCEVLHNSLVKIHESMQIEDRYKHFRDNCRSRNYPLGTCETNLILCMCPLWRAISQLGARNIASTRAGSSSPFLSTFMIFM